jgi:hypothetical protein
MQGMRMAQTNYLKATVFDKVKGRESHGKDGGDMKGEAKNHLESHNG